ncbi:uncharacterized protein LOC132203195 [Neocloeon triangulifer]|uniref:uncharacterized protein LOC132203195 n=1 Tax=Neocloeon triangulifer TaxID=2078957 RepID=UPI00286EF5DB|nr:uncharacterized protein LOC132203195 [Neocloeon triangulifer]
MHLMETKSGLQGDLARPSPLPQLGSSPPQTWLHSPPAQMPWGTKQPALVRFTGGLYGGGLNNGTSSMPFTLDTCQPYNFPMSAMPGPSQVHSVGIKRKVDVDEAEMLSAVNKLHISETKLASHRAGLHALNQQSEQDDEAFGPRLVLSDELKQLTAQDTILPKPLMDRMRNKNSMALVLWQPPNPRMMPMPDGEPDEQDGNNNNNNGSESIDLNIMPTFNEEPRLPDFTVPDDGDVEMEML